MGGRVDQSIVDQDDQYAGGKRVVWSILHLLVERQT